MEASLNLIKNKYAQEKRYKDWETLIHSVINHAGINGRYAAIIAVEKHLNEICIRAQKAALEKAAENAKLKHIGANYREPWCVDHSSITNPENLIR